MCKCRSIHMAGGHEEDSRHSYCSPQSRELKQKLEIRNFIQFKVLEMHNCSQLCISKTSFKISSSRSASRSVLSQTRKENVWLRSGSSVIFVYTGRRIEDMWFDSSGYHRVCWSITVFCFGLLPTLILSSVWSCLAMCSIFFFTAFFVLFCFLFDTVLGGLSHFRTPLLERLLRTKIAHSGLQAPSEHGAPVQRDRSRILGSWGSWQRGPETQGYLPFCLKSDTRLQMEELLGLCS